MEELNKYIKKYKQFESLRRYIGKEHEDIDPYGEEDWDGKLDLNLDDNFRIDSKYVEEVYTYKVTLAGINLNFTLTIDEEGFSHFDWKFINSEDAPRVDICDFIEDHWEEIKELLTDER
jgi:hypothetical protein